MSKPIQDSYNDYKVVNIKRNNNKIIDSTGKTVSYVNTDWRHNLCNLICNSEKLISSTSQKFVAENFFNDNNHLIVDDNIKLLLETYPQIQVNNEFEEPISVFLGDAQSMGEKIGGSSFDKFTQGLSKAMSVATKGVEFAQGLFGNKEKAHATLYPWIKSVPAWKGIKNNTISFTQKFSFKIGQYGLWNALEEVVKPVINLFVPVLPRELNNFSIAGPLPTSYQMLGNLLKGGIDSVVDQLFEDDEGSISFIQSLVTETYGDYTYDVSYGNIFKFENCIYKDATLNFDTNDTDQNGYPISATISMTFSTIIPPHLASTNQMNYQSLRFGDNQ